MLAEPGQAVADMHALRWQRINEHLEHVSAVRLILPETKITFGLRSERSSQQSSPVVPALLMHGCGHDTEAGEPVTQAQPMNHARCVWRHVDAGANLA